MNRQERRTLFEEAIRDLSQTDIIAVAVSHSPDCSEVEFAVWVRAEDAEKFLRTLQTSSRHLRNLDTAVAAAIEETGGDA